jgi:hypothetical protein
VRRLFGLPAIVALLCAGLGACGGAGKTHDALSSATASATAQGGSGPSPAHHESLAAPVMGDSDGDSAERTAFDGDDFHSMHFGHAADGADRQAIAAIVKRYYAALAAEDAPTVCSLLLEVVAESLPEGDYRDSGKAPQTPASRETCPPAISDVLAESHRALLSESRTLRVIGVRVRRRRASALLRFGGTSARHILLYKEEGKWKIGTLADEDLG